MTTSKDINLQQITEMKEGLIKLSQSPRFLAYALVHGEILDLFLSTIYTLGKVYTLVEFDLSFDEKTLESMSNNYKELVEYFDK